MNRILISTDNPYEVIIRRGLLHRAGGLISEIHKPCAAAVVTDDIGDGLYGDIVADSLSAAGYKVSRFAFPNGEASKNLNTFERILSFLAESDITRSDLVVALGGGVVGDLAGFAAASYMRGIDFVQIPTTLLAAIDSSVGGKTGLNLGAGKNLCGAFHQPRMVIADCDTFSTLAPDFFADGAAEAIKYGVISDRTLFDKMKLGAAADAIDEIVARCVKIKRDFVLEDEFDYGQRRLLNLGHTFGHAIERLSSYATTHGHAVGIGLLIAASAAKKLGVSTENCTPAIKSALEANNLPTQTAYSAELLTNAMMNDKKRDGSSISLILPVEIGRCVIHELPVSGLGALVASAMEEAL